MRKVTAFVIFVIALAFQAAVVLVMLAPRSAAAYQPSSEIANMHAHCQCVMRAGVCGGYNQASLSTMPPEKAGIPKLLGVTLGIVTRGEWHTWNTNPLMCEQLVADCSTDWSSAGCRIARAQFRQDAEFECGAGEHATAQAPATSEVPSINSAALGMALLAIYGVMSALGSPRRVAA